jgi:hypothetical protein
MTALVLKSYSLVREGFIAGLAAWMIGHMKAVGKAIELSRSCSANETIARHLLREYPGHTYGSLLHELNQKTLERIYGK